jgi:hypothetical protein
MYNTKTENIQLSKKLQKEKIKKQKKMNVLDTSISDENYMSSNEYEVD